MNQSGFNQKSKTTHWSMSDKEYKSLFKDYIIYNCGRWWKVYVRPLSLSLVSGRSGKSIRYHERRAQVEENEDQPKSRRTNRSPHLSLTISNLNGTGGLQENLSLVPWSWSYTCSRIWGSWRGSCGPGGCPNNRWSNTAAKMWARCHCAEHLCLPSKCERTLPLSLFKSHVNLSCS